MTFIQFNGKNSPHSYYRNLCGIAYEGTYLNYMTVNLHRMNIPSEEVWVKMLDNTIRKVTAGNWIIFDDKNKRFFQDLRYLPKV